ncbi:hypothetical protein BC828DRAFT_393441 [Blastocladiella britannica]|nr:hypothetical protein BC828DRAFT_393441 [Blastocladiella britannica]
MYVMDGSAVGAAWIVLGSAMLGVVMVAAAAAAGVVTSAGTAALAVAFTAAAVAFTTAAVGLYGHGTPRAGSPAMGRAHSHSASGAAWTQPIVMGSPVAVAATTAAAHGSGPGVRSHSARSLVRLWGPPPIASHGSAPSGLPVQRREPFGAKVQPENLSDGEPTSGMGAATKGTGIGHVPDILSRTRNNDEGIGIRPNQAMFPSRVHEGGRWVPF